MLSLVTVIEHFIHLLSSDWLIIHDQTIRNIAGIVLVLWGYGDGIKYHFQSQKIKQVKSAKGNSRKFMNLALGNDQYKLFYFFFVIRDFYVLLTSIIALIFMYELFWVIYVYYPYKMRKCLHFKKPHLMLYFLNSLIPNKIRKRL